MFLNSALKQTFTAHNDVFHTFSRFLFVSMRLTCQNIYIRPCDLACYVVCTVICFNGTCVFVNVCTVHECTYLYIRTNRISIYVFVHTNQWKYFQQYVFRTASSGNVNMYECL